MPTKTEAIKNFLTEFSPLANLYSSGMEVQVNVAQDGGDPITGEGYTGRLWRGFTDGEQQWKSFRIPWNANTKPEYTDSNLNFCLLEHAEGIGMTGWCWKDCVSKWVAFDFDSITGHNTGLTAEELDTVTESAKQIPWVTVRKSTSGNGLHLYVFVDNIHTENHNEHSALARAILGKMTAATGFDFNSVVDICGGNIWVWHRKTKGTNGLELIKQGEILKSVPDNWRDHIPVINGRRRRNKPGFIEDKDESLFDQLTGQYPKIKLDTEHRKLLDFLEENNCQWWYDSDNGMLVCHTSDIKIAYSSLGMRGLFDTIAIGRDKPDHNSFLFPLEFPSGSWIVRRFSPGVTEAPTWFQDASGYTTCYLNKEPTLNTAARSSGGIEDEKGNFFFNEAKDAEIVAKTLGVDLALPGWASNRKTTIKQHRDGKRIIVAIDKERNDTLPGWKDDKTQWKRIFDAKISQPISADTQNYDNIVRHLVDTSGNDYGWVLNANGDWHSEPLHHLKIALKSLGYGEIEINKALGKCVLDSWRVVNKPFENEFPGNREWNKGSVQLRFLPQIEEPRLHPNWDRLIGHVGSGLDDAVKNDGWCLANGIIAGADYLRLWIASLFQSPTKHLPYLFLYSPEQQSGKTSFHEALRLLITGNGYIDAKAALISQAGFNEEMKGAILAIVDECNLNINKSAYNRIKDWITALEILIHGKGKTPYLAPNISHFIQTGNGSDECPILSGDTRITVIRVPPIDPVDLIPKETLFRALEKEASAFLGTIFKIEIPPCNDRLAIPVVNTEQKEISIQHTQSELDTFINEDCYYSPGESIRYNDFWIKFQGWLDPNSLPNWTKIKVGRSLNDKYSKGRLASDGSQFHIANISFTPPDPESPGKKLVLRGGMLVMEGS